MPGGYDGDIKLKVDLTPGDIKRTARVLQNNVKDVFDATAGKELNKEFQKLQANIAKTSGRANQLSKQLDDLWENKKVPTEEYAEIQEQINEARKKLEDLNKQMQMAKDLGIDTKNSNAFKSLVAQADELQNTIKYANGELEDLKENNQAWQLDTSAQMRYQALLTQLNDVNNALTLQLRLLQESAQQSGYVNQTTSKFSSLRDAINSVVSAMRETWEFGPNLSTIIGQSVRNAQQHFDSLKQSILNIGPSIRTILSSVQGVFARIGSSAQSAGSVILSGLQHPLLSLDHILGFLISSAGQAVRAIGSLAATGAGNALSALGAGAKQAAITLGGALVSALRSVASSAANAAKQLAKVATARLTSGIKNLVSHFNLLGKSANRSVPSVKKVATTLLKYGLGVRSFYFLFRKIRSAIAEGFSNLANESEPFKATMDEFKQSLTTLKNTFAASFAPIASVVIPALTSLINVVSSAIEAVGKLIATLMGKKTYTKAVKGFNSVSNSAGNANAQAQELQKTIAGFDDVEILGSNNPASNGSGSGGDGGASGMFEEVPIENEFGKLAEMIKDAWKKADFTDIGRMIGEKLRDALDSIPWDLVKEKMRQVAKSIATLLNGFLETPGLFDAIGSTLAEALNSGLEFLNTFAKEFHWDSLGRAISDGINGFFRTADFKLGAETFSNWAKGLLETIYTTLENIDWRQIGAKIKEFITNVDWTGIIEGIARTIGAAIGGAVALIVEVFKDVPGKIKEYFAKKIEEKKAEFGDNGKAIFLGILQGILDAIKGIGKWIKEHVLEPFITGFKNAFGIASPAKETKSIGEEILNGILEGMLNIVKNIKKWVSEHVLEPIKNAFKGFKATIEVGLEKAKDWASDVWEGIKAGAETIKKTIQTKMSKLAGWKDEIFNFFTDGIGSIVKTIKSKMNTKDGWDADIFKFFTNGISTIFKTIKAGLGWDDKNTNSVLKSVVTAIIGGVPLTLKLLAKLTGKSADSKTPQTVFGAAFGILAKLTGKSSDSNTPQGVFGSTYNTTSTLTGPSAHSKTTRDVYGSSFDVLSNLTGAAWGTKWVSDVFGTVFNVFSKLSGAAYGTYWNPQIFGDVLNVWSKLSGAAYGTYWNYQVFGDVFDVYAKLRGAAWGTMWLNDVFGYVVDVRARIVGAVNNLKSLFGWATGGVYTPQSGWSEIPQYAGGTTNAHGSMFIAGEAGPEVVGHINGRTEVLNKSQIASAIYAAVKTAMSVGMNQLRAMIPIPMPINIDIESLGIPDIVKGCIVPYEVRLTAMEDMIANQNPDPVTAEELRGLMNDVIDAMNKVQFYIGDEQIARHVNLGNQKLDRRYNPIAQGG